MSSWSRQRRFAYGGTVLLVIIIVAAIVGWKLFYTKPTCFDGIQNGQELGIDCGGECQKLCPSAFLPPQAHWTRFEKIAPGLYNTATYIVNPNPQGEAKNAPYHIEIYDDKGILITEYNGTVTLPPQRNTLAFKSSVNVGDSRIPSKAVFTFTDIPDWEKKSDPLKAITVTDREYAEEGNASTLSVTLRNNSAENIPKFTVYVVLYDRAGTAVGFSKTIVDGIGANGIILAPFTWPTNRNNTVVSIEVLPVAE